MLEYDGIADFYVRKFEDFEEAFKDPEYLEKIYPDELKLVDFDTLILTVGYDYVVVEDSKKVETHARSF